MMDINRVWAKNPYTSQQVKSEIWEFINILHDHQVKNLLEIGFFECGTSYLFYNVIQPGGKLISVDIEPLKRKMNFHNYVPNIRDVSFKIVVGNSHDQSVLNVVKETLNGESLDALFIDGDHSFEGVKSDFEMYSPLVRKDGIVAFHDIAHHKPTLKCYVEKYYHRLIESHQHMEIIERPDQGWAGIGILYMGANQ